MPTVLPRTRSCARIAFHSWSEMRSTRDSDLPTADADAFTFGPTWRANPSTWSSSRPTVCSSLNEDRSLHPDPARAQAQRRKRLDQRDLRGLRDVERASHRRHDRRQAEHLVLPGAVLGVEVVDVAPRDRRGQPFSDILQPALGEGEDLVAARAVLQRQRDQLDRRAPVHGEHVDERLERHALRCAEAAVRSRAIVVLGPRQLEIGAKRCEQHVDETRRRGDQVFARFLAEHGRAQASALAPPRASFFRSRSCPRPDRSQARPALRPDSQP